MWTKPTDRNFEGIQYESIRKKVDSKYNDAHDELSDCFYNKKPFREYGILDKETFDKLHGLIFDLRDIELNTENAKLPAKEQDSKLSAELSQTIGGKTKLELVANKIEFLSKEGIKLTI